MEIKIPNLEIRDQFMSYISEGLIKEHNFNTELMLDVARCVQKYLVDTTKFKTFGLDLIKTFKNLIQSLPEFGKITQDEDDDQRNNIIHANESLIHSLLYCTILLMRTEIGQRALKVGSEVPINGLKRSDIVFIISRERQDLKKLVVIIELKFGKSCQEAIQQIHDREYYRHYVNNYEVHLVGLNVDMSKNVDVLVQRV